MKKLFPLLMILVLLLPCSHVSAQQAPPIPAEVIAMVDEAVSLVRSNIPRRVDTPIVIGVEGLQTAGAETQMGELFAMVLTSRLANEGDSRIRVFAGQHLEAMRRSNLLLPGGVLTEGILAPDLVLNGKLYLTQGDLHAILQLIQLPDFTVVGGTELSFTISSAARDLLRTIRTAGEEGWDPFEPDSIDQPRRLVPGETSSGNSIMPTGDEDWFLLQVDEIEGSGFINVYTAGSTDTYIEVYGPDDQNMSLTENDDGDDQNAWVGFPAAAGQRFWIKVRGYDESTTGSYAIASEIEIYEEDALEPNDRLEDANALEINEDWLSSTLVPIGDADWYFIDVPASGSQDVLLVVETSGNMDTYLDMFDRNGDLILSDDDGGDDANAGIGMMAGEGGRFYLRVRHYDDSDSGSYMIRVFIEQVVRDQYEPDDTIENAAAIAVDEEEQRHTFVPGEDVDWVRFSISSGRTVTVETGGDTDTVMILFDRDENMIAEDDDSGDGGNARIERFLQPGTYFVRITQFDDNPMSGAEYSIAVSSR